MNQNVIRAAVTVFGFWWIILAIYGVIAGIGDPVYLVQSTLAVTVLVIAGIVMGVLCTTLLIWTKKRGDIDLLAGESVRGLVCTIGELPVVQREPARAAAMPDLTSIPDVEPNFYQSWFDRHDRAHPAHAKLMRALILVLAHRNKLPATHVAGGHGGRSLLHHSLLVGAQMERLGRTWTYTGLRSKTRNTVLLSLREPNYKFDADDPMVAIIGLAHDIGKLESYILDPKDPDHVVGIGHEHDMTGARMIARLPEVWQIPDRDRTAMFLAIAHYHHPMELPLSSDSRAIDDRTIALMELLIKADFVTSAIEAKGVTPSDQEYEKSFEEPAAPTVDDVVLFKELSELLLESERINSGNRKFNIATLCHGQGFDKPMLFIREDALRGAMSGRLRLGPEQPMGDGRYPITVRILRLFAAKGVLVQELRGKKFKAENALWNVDFGARPAAGAQPEKKAGWSAVIVIDPALFPAIESAAPYWWYARIQRPTMGSARATKSILAPSAVPNLSTTDEPSEDNKSSDAELSNEAEVDQAQRPELDDVHDDEAAEAGLRVKPRRQKRSPPPDAIAGGKAAHTAAIEPDAEAASSKLQDAIGRVVRAMMAQQFAPIEIETHYLITHEQLSSTVPDFDWSLAPALLPALANKSGADIRCVQPDPNDRRTLVIGVPKAAKAPTPPAPAPQPLPTAVEKAEQWNDAPWDGPSAVAYQPLTEESFKSALVDLVRRVEADAIEVPRQADRIILSATALSQACPQMDWAGSLQALSGMSERGEIKASIRNSDKPGAGGFFVEFSVDDFSEA